MTTPVGDIRLDLSINGEGLSDDLLRAIRQSVLPMVAEMQKQLREVERAQQRVAREAEKSGAKQTAAANAAEGAVEDVGDAHTKMGAKATAAGGMSTRAINNQTRAMARHMAQVLATAAAYDKLTASQTAAAAAPQPPPPPRGGVGGGGGGSPGGGNHFSRGQSGSGGFFGFGGPVVGAAGWNGVAAIVGSFPAAATAVVNLTGAIQNLTQAGLVLPGIFATAGASIGTAVLGFKGMSDAVEDLTEAFKSGDTAELEKVREQLKLMAPAALETAEAFAKFAAGPLKDLQTATSQTMFEGVAAQFDDLTNKAMPTITRGTQQVASAWNGTFKELGRVIGDDSTLSLVDQIFGNTADAQNRANGAIQPLIHGFGTLAAEGSDFIPRLADGLDTVATRFDNWITKSVENGNLDKWIDNGFEAASDLGESLLNVGKIITGLTEAAGGDGGFLQWLRDATGALQTLVNSADGQSSLREFFAEGRDQLAQWGAILANLGPIIQSIYNSMKAWADVLLPFLQEATQIISSMPGGIEAVTTAFLAWKTLGGIGALITGLTTVGGLLDGIDSKATKAGKGVGGMGLLSGGGRANGVLGGLALTAGGLTADGPLGALMTVGGAGLTGASIGGLPGALAGLVAGAMMESFKAGIAGFEAWSQAREQLANNQGEPGVPFTQAAPQGPGLNSMPTPGMPVPGEYTPPNSAPINEVRDLLGGTAAAADNATSKIGQLGQAVSGLPPGTIEITDNIPEAESKIGNLEQTVSGFNGLLVVDAATDAAEQKLKSFLARWKQTPLTMQVGVGGAPTTGSVRATPGLPPGLSWGSADGGVLPGYSPGVDNMLWPMSGGEGVVIPEAMRALGPRWLYTLNSRFRAGLSRRGYADGGVVGGVPGVGLPPADLAAAMQPVVELLSQILTTLGGNAGGDLATQIGGQTATALSTATGGMGLTATEDKIAKELAAGKIDLRMPWERAADDRAIAAERMAMQQGPTGLPLGGDFRQYASSLAAFAKSGDLASVSGLGLNANDPVITALTSARNKKKNGLADDEIAALVEQIVGGGGYTGVLDETNSPLIKSLTRYREQLAKKQGGYSATAAMTGVPLMSLSGAGVTSGADGLVPAADTLARVLRQAYPQLTEIGGVRQDAHPDHPSGRALDIMIPGGDTSGGRNPEGKALGDQIWEQLMASGIVDPNGSLWQTNTGGNHFNHIHARIAEGMENAMPGVLPGLGMTGLDASANPLGYSGGPVPVYIVGGPDGQMGDAGQALMNGLLGGANDVAGNLIDSLGNAVAGLDAGDLPAEGLSAYKLFKEGNPQAIAALAGYKVGDYNRTGAQGQADNLTVNDGPAFNAQGQIFSDTAALIDRSFTSLWAKMQAEFQQLQDTLVQVRDQLTQISTQLAQAALNSANGAASSAVGQGFAYGGSVTGGTWGKDSVPALLMPGEHVLTTSDVAALGGQANVYAFRRMLAAGQVQGFATGGGVNVNDTVGAEFFGVSQIPIIGMIVNVLVRVLLAVLGVQIEARDTLNEMTDEFRQFRGEFEAFDASGRLINDTSALSERSQSSEELATQERVRILKIVIEALIKYIIEKVIVPMAKAVANSLLQAAGSAVQGAAGAGSMGMGGQILGGMASSLITGVGGAGVDVIAEVGSTIATNLAGAVIDVIGDGLLGLFPGLMQAIFGGGLIEQFIIGPIQMLLQPILGIFGGLSGAVGGLFAPFLGLLGGMASFDEGGIAAGMGLMPKATIRPERVLSPQQTESFDRLVDAMVSGRTGTGTSRVIQGDVHIHLPGTTATPERIGSTLMELMT